jgi:hypothetical protein
VCPLPTMIVTLTDGNTAATHSLSWHRKALTLLTS